MKRKSIACSSYHCTHQVSLLIALLIMMNIKKIVITQTQRLACNGVKHERARLPRKTGEKRDSTTWIETQAWTKCENSESCFWKNNICSGKTTFAHIQRMDKAIDPRYLPQEPKVHKARAQHWAEHWSVPQTYIFELLSAFIWRCFLKLLWILWAVKNIWRKSWSSFKKVSIPWNWRYTYRNLAEKKHSRRYVSES